MPFDLFDYPHDYIPGDVIKENLYNKLRLEPDLTKQRNILRQYNSIKDLKVYAPTVYEGKKYGKRLRPKYNIVIFLSRFISIVCLGILSNQYFSEYHAKCPRGRLMDNFGLCLEAFCVTVLQLIVGCWWTVLGIYNIARYIDVVFTLYIY